MNACLDLGAAIGQDTSQTLFQGLWATNAIGGNLVSGRAGILQQMEVSMGNWGTTPPSEWSDCGTFIGNRGAGIANFLAFFTPSHTATYVDSESGQTYTGRNTNLSTVAPFTPAVKLALPMSWQANDPLVHFVSEELLYSDLVGQIRRIKPAGSTNYVTLENIGYLNKRYKPWPAELGASDLDSDAFNLTLKDPSVGSSDGWRFPTNECTTISQLGQLHRGTPWQTIYLKSADVNLSTWRTWSGHADPSVAQHTRPVRDWSLAALIASLLNTNPLAQLLSINNPGTNAWLAVLDGLNVITNSSSDSQLAAGQAPQFSVLTVASNSPQAESVETSIFTTRSNNGGAYRSLGELLASPALSLSSPWLNQSTAMQLKRGLTDEAYECLPAQLLARVRPDSVGELATAAGGCRVQFTGWDAWAYVVESSPDLVNWIPVSTNNPVNGVFGFPLAPTAPRVFYRSRLLP
jgi:hypothetical protein